MIVINRFIMIMDYFYIKVPKTSFRRRNVDSHVRYVTFFPLLRESKIILLINRIIKEFIFPYN